MKRTILIVLMSIAIVTFAQAQNRDRQGQGGAPAPRTPPEAVTVTGNLTIAKGMIALKAGDATYLTPSLNRYVGFIDSLKDGAQVKLEGFAAPNRARAGSANADAEKADNNKVTFFMPNKMTIGGKDYDLGRPQMNMGMQNWQKGSMGQQKGQKGMQGKNNRQHQGKGKNTPQGRSGHQGKNGSRR